MTNKMARTVALKKVGNVDNINNLRKNIEKLLNPFIDINQFFENHKSILLKPNLVAPKNFLKGATTNPYLVKALAKLILEKNPGCKLYVGDGSAVGQDTTQVLETAGYEKLFGHIKDDRVNLIDIKQENFKEYSISGGKAFSKLNLPEFLEEIDLLINLPVIKTHDVFPATLGLKNLKGLIAEGDKKKFHQLGLAEAIVDLNLLLHNFVMDILTIYDGTIAMEGAGPVEGEPVNFKLLGAATSTLVGDKLISRCMGINPQSIKYLTEADARGLAEVEEQEIIVAGEKVEEIRREFSYLNFALEFYQKFSINLIEAGGCSGCRHLLDNLVANFSKEELSSLRNHNIYLGPDGNRADNDWKTIRLGSCTKHLAYSGLYIPGCPPHPEIVKARLLK